MKRQEQGAVSRSAVFAPETVTKLTDAAATLFRLLYDLERAMKQDAKARLAAELGQLDLFGLTVNRTNSSAEEYQPDEPDWCS